MTSSGEGVGALSFTSLFELPHVGIGGILENGRQLDPHQRLTFLSDGNQDFAKALGLQMSSREMFMQGRSQRYLLVVKEGAIVQVGVEDNISNYCCTRARGVVEVE